MARAANAAVLRRYQQAIEPVIASCERVTRSGDAILGVEEEMLRERMAIEIQTLESTMSPSQWHIISMASVRSEVVLTRDTPGPKLRRFLIALEVALTDADPSTEVALL